MYLCTYQSEKNVNTSHTNEKSSPVGGNAGVEIDEIAVDLVVINVNESRLGGEGADGASTGDGFTEVDVDRRSRL